MFTFLRLSCFHKLFFQRNTANLGAITFLIVLKNLYICVCEKAEKFRLVNILTGKNNYFLQFTKLYLIFQDNAEINHRQHITGCVFCSSSVCDVRPHTITVVHIRWCTKVCCVNHLTTSHQSFFTLIQHTSKHINILQQNLVITNPIIANCWI